MLLGSNTIDARLIQRLAVGELTKADLDCSARTGGEASGAASTSATACGLGFELALVLPLLLWLDLFRRRGATRRARSG
jgi:hypothetical protein